jgi:hypothetical protein
MPTVDFKPIAVDGAANVISQAAFETALASAGSLEHGFKAGTAVSAEINKVVRQSSMMTAAVANAISDLLGVDVLDNGDLSALKVLFKAAIAVGAWSTGDAKLTLKVVPDAGWIMCDDGTIGDASSSATNRANADTAALYSLLWNNISNSWAPVTGGRGASAAADFAAHKPIKLNRTLGRAIAIAGSGSSLTARALGEFLGEEGVTLTVDGMPAHTHGIKTGSGVGGSGANTASTVNVGDETTRSTGNGAAHNNMPPVSFFNAMIKL